jgi:hypothetical protein
MRGILHPPHPDCALGRPDCFRESDLSQARSRKTLGVADGTGFLSAARARRLHHLSFLLQPAVVAGPGAEVLRHLAERTVSELPGPALGKGLRQHKRPAAASALADGVFGAAIRARLLFGFHTGVASISGVFLVGVSLLQS